MKDSAAERDLIVKTVRQFVAREVIPVASEMERRDEYPDALVAQMERDGPVRIECSRRVWRSGDGLHHFRDGLRGACSWLAGAGRGTRNAPGGVRCPLTFRDGRSEAALSSDAGAGRKEGRDMPFGARRRDGPAEHHDHREPHRRSLRNQRLEDVDHERAPRRHVRSC